MTSIPVEFLRESSDLAREARNETRNDYFGFARSRRNVGTAQSHHVGLPSETTTKLQPAHFHRVLESACFEPRAWPCGWLCLRVSRSFHHAATGAKSVRTTCTPLLPRSSSRSSNPAFIAACRADAAI